jgi:shikimate kinase
MIEAIRRVVLLGYMCSGKSTVGASLARRLEWAFVDLDAEIEHQTGQPVKTLVATEGAGALRELEAELTDELAQGHGLVIAPGGGWITQPGLLRVLGADTLSVWLQTSPGEIVRRLRADPMERPLREHPDPLPVIEEMLAARAPLYRLADLALPTDGCTAEEVAFQIERTVRGD